MPLIQINSTDGAENIYDINVPVVVTNVLTTGVSYDITDAGGATTVDITIDAGTVTMTGAAYIQNMNELIEEAIADPYAIPNFTQTYRNVDAYLHPVEYHSILTQGTT